MIDELRHDDLMKKVGGRFKLAALIQRRWLELLQGARPMVDPSGLTEMEVVIQEIVEGKVEMELPAEDDVLHHSQSTNPLTVVEERGRDRPADVCLGVSVNTAGDNISIYMQQLLPVVGVVEMPAQVENGVGCELEGGEMRVALHCDRIH